MLDTWRALPGTARAGLAVMGTGLIVDLALHAVAAVAAPEHLAHSVILAGMVLVILGVIADGIGRTRRQQRSRA
ncbi:MAG TPA: hypothetical protein VGT60_06690 [Candidatus Limnocylindria bacterium]|nr:hypothetical protein [Candidatus Limnocylindria bacterium]